MVAHDLKRAPGRGFKGTLAVDERRRPIHIFVFFVERLIAARLQRQQIGVSFQLLVGARLAELQLHALVHDVRLILNLHTSVREETAAIAFHGGDRLNGSDRNAQGVSGILIVFFCQWLRHRATP